MTTNFPNPANTSSFEHFPNNAHGVNISMKLALESCSSFDSFHLAPGGMTPRTCLSSLLKSLPCHKKNNIQTVCSTSPLQPFLDPWPLLRKSYKSQNKRDIHLIVHGSAGGRIPSIIKNLSEAVSALRGTTVQVEALTFEKPPLQSSKSVWLVPLLLLPGQHVRKDIPLIRKRMVEEGIMTTLLPFLGSWPGWVLTLKEFTNIRSSIGIPALIHHPLSSQISNRYVIFLKQILQTPVVAWNNWEDFRISSEVRHSLIPLTLAPNRHTNTFCKEADFSSLLEVDFVRNRLVDMLRHLP